MLEPYHITHTSTQLSAGLVEQFFLFCSIGAPFWAHDEFGSILSQSTFFIGSA
jgi:hypothetical protein